MSFFVIKEVVMSCSNTCYVSLRIERDDSRDWLIDTGASISAVLYKCIRNLCIPIQDSKLVVNGIGGKVQAIGYVYLNLIAGEQTFRHKFFVFETLPSKVSGILGQDFLQKYQSILNFGNNKLTLWKNNFKICLPITKQSRSLTIPARSESIHFIETEKTEECVICASDLGKGIFMASTLVTPMDGRVPVRILNTTDKDCTISELKPIIHLASDYNICKFEKSKKNADRVKKLFTKLDLDHLNLEERSTIKSVCAKYNDIFYLEGDKLTTTKLYEHSISLKPNTQPIFSKPYRLPHSQKEEIQKQIDNMLDQGIIEPCNSEWSSPVLLVPKKCDVNGNKKWRLVIDYRKLNNSIENDKFPLPNINEILDSLSGCIYFSHLDLNQGFYNVKLKKECRKFTAFCSGRYQMRRMPMGLKTSPNSFARMMTMAMAGLTYEKCLCYQDDLIVIGRNLTDHNNNLVDVFERIRNVNLKLNPEKCDFLKQELLYLGHVVSGDGVLPDPEKIECIKNYPTPQTTDEVKRFVALANYYRKFIKNFADIAYYLNCLCRKNAKFVWDDKCQKSFETLKQCMISPPVLQYPDLSKTNQFTVQTDASGYAIGAILSNADGRPVAYASRSLNKAERNYPTIEKELLAVVWAVKHFRPYLYGRTFKIITDHKPLVYLFNLKDPSSRLLKFRLLLEEYDYVVEYVKGKDNAAADALSRVTISSKDLNEMHDSVCVMTRAQRRNLVNPSRDDIVSSDVRSDQPKIVETYIKPKNGVELRFIDKISLDKLRSEKVITNENNVFSFSDQQKIIYINPSAQSQFTRAEFVRAMNEYCSKFNIEEVYFLKDTNTKIFIEKLTNEIGKNKNYTGPRLCILKNVERVDDKDDRRVILNDFHLLPTSGHAGIRRMFNNIKKYYFWPKLEKDVIDFVKKCPKCQKQKYTVVVKEPLVVTSTAHSTFEKIFLDIVGPVDRDYYNYNYILTMQCELSKYVCAFPLVTKTSEEVARVFVNNFVLQHGVPGEIATDRGTEFMSDLFKEVCKLLNISKLNSTAYHHQSIGALENSHKSLGSFLRIQTDEKPDSWSTWLPFWCFAYNTTVHTSTKFTPFELVYGKKCNLPNNLCKTVEPLYNHSYYPLELKYRLQVSQTEARNNLIKDKIKRKSKFDSYMNPVCYKKNDKILIKNETGNKLSDLYSGPYTVVRDLSPNVEVNINGKIDLVHKNRTKPYYE